VLLQAGLEGIEKGYELPGPMEENLYHLPGEERLSGEFVGGVAPTWQVLAWG